MKILFNDLKKQYEMQRADIDPAIQSVVSSGYLVLGPKVKEFESSFAAYIGTKYGVGVANGLDALLISLKALEIGSGDEVITTSLSAVATTLAIVNAGATPIFVDIDEYGHVDPAEIERKITKKTKAIIPVHLYGQSVDIESIILIAKKNNLHLIEDCAQAHGAAFKDKKVGTFGISGCFSFYPTKNLGAYGDAGMIVTNDAAFAEKCSMIRNYGQKNRYEHEVAGINSRLDELQASILNAKLKYLDKENQRRGEIAKLYRQHLGNLPGLTIIPERPDCKNVNHLFVIQTDKREELQAHLAKKDIPALIHYPIPIHKQKCFLEWNNLELPNTEKFVSRILSLPIHPYLTDEEVLYACEGVKSFYA